MTSCDRDKQNGFEWIRKEKKKSDKIKNTLFIFTYLMGWKVEEPRSNILSQAS